MNNKLNKIFCPRCNSNNIVKNGTARNKKRYRCKNCIHDFIKDTEKTNRSPKVVYKDLKILATLLYFLGYNVKDIFKYLISDTIDVKLNSKIIYQWINKMNITKQRRELRNKKIVYLKRSGDFPQNKGVYSKAVCNEILIIIYIIKTKNRKDCSLNIQVNKKPPMENNSLPFWLNFLFFLLLQYKDINSLSKLFKISPEELSLFTKKFDDLFNYNKIIKYNHLNYLKFCDFSPQYNNIIQTIKTNKKEINKVILISFNWDLENLIIEAFEQEL